MSQAPKTSPKNNQAGAAPSKTHQKGKSTDSNGLERKRSNNGPFPNQNKNGNNHRRQPSSGGKMNGNNNNNNNNGINGQRQHLQNGQSQGQRQNGQQQLSSPNSQPQQFFAVPQGAAPVNAAQYYYQSPSNGPMSPLGASPMHMSMSPGAWGTPRMAPQYYAIDVECVATGPKHNQRAVAQIALVDQWERVLLNFYVKPKEEVFSYLKDITGLDEKLLSTGVDLETGIQMVRSALPPSAILVGQNILKDVQWLGLREGVDFSSMMDLNGLWRVFNERYKSYTYFSLHHQAKALLGISQEPPHNAATDSILSIRLFNLFQSVEVDETALTKARETLLSTPIEPSFAKNNPEYDGVCMGNKKTCKCGAPFFF